VAEGISAPTALAAPGAVEPATATGVEPVTAEPAPEPVPAAGEPESALVAVEVTCAAAAVTGAVTAGRAGRVGDEPVSACACRAKMSMTKKIPATAITP
jgi:hypothetical protein